MKNKKLIKLDNVKSVMQFLQQPTIKMAEALTGILASDMKDWKISAGRIIQSVIKCNLLTQLGREIEKYREEGKIKEDYLKNDINRASFKELLKFIDEEVPDEMRFKAMKSIFLTSVTEGATEKEEKMAYELTQICRKLSSGEILVLKAVDDIINSRLAPNMPGVTHSENNASRWLSIVATQSNLEFPELIEVYEKKLIELKLITNRMYPDQSGVVSSQHFRLTRLGLKLCEFITKYET